MQLSATCHTEMSRGYQRGHIAVNAEPSNFAFQRTGGSRRSPAGR